MEEDQYSKHKDSFKKQCVYTAIGSGFSIMTIILIFFLKVFRYNITFNGEILSSFDFSLFEVTKEIVSNIGNVGWFYIYLLSTIVFFIIGIVQSLIITFKNILNVANLDDYSLTAYDDMKNRNESGIQKKQMNRMQSNYFLYLSIVYLIIDMWLGRIIVSSLEIDPSNYSYVMLFLNFNGISAIIILPLITLIASIVFFAIGNSIKKKIRIAILKEELNN